MNMTLAIGPLVALIAGILILVVPRLLNFIVAIYLIIIGPLVALIAGILILILPRLLNFIVAIYLILVGLLGLFGGHIH